MVELTIGEDGLTAADHARQVWQALRVEIIQHLEEDMSRLVTGLDEMGLPSAETPRCLSNRERFLADAPFVSVVVPTYNRPTALAACVHSLRSLDYPNFEIIVVDNAPTVPAGPDPGTRPCLDMPRVRWVREGQKGLSSARNRGLAEARGEIVAFVDDDVVVDRYWLTELARGFERGKHVGAVTGLVLPLELQTRAQVWFELYRGFGKGFTRQVFDMGENRPKSALFPYAAAMFGSGNNMAFRTSVLRQLHGFDPLLGAGVPARGGEDLAVFYRVIARGYQLLYEPAAVVRHQHRRDDAGLRNQIYAYGVGLTAYVTSIVLLNPTILVRLALAGPAIIRYFRQTRASNRQKRQAGYPSEFRRLELRGMLHGPLAYLGSRLAAASRAGTQRP